MSSKPQIVYFDDDASNLTMFREILTHEFDVSTFQNPMTYARAVTPKISAFLLDVFMPGMDGFSLYRHIKSHPEYNSCPVVFISSDVSDLSRIQAYGLGAQDFFHRTIPREELVIRLRNRIAHFADTKFRHTKGSLELDTRSLRVSLQKSAVDVTLTEFKILKGLLQSSAQVITREELCHLVWPGLFVQATTLNTHLSNLRTKLTAWEFDIQSVKGKGIQVVEKGTSP
jgi:two-component system alkaline phosphatase synthesis response regulator PhoP